MSMRHTFKVASWEIKRNLKNKSFIIGLFLTPLIIALFMIVPNLFNDSDTEAERIDVFIHDELNLLNDLEQAVSENDAVNWQLATTDLDHQSMLQQLETEENMAYIPLTEEVLAEGSLTIYTSETINDDFSHQTHILEELIKNYQLEQLDLTAEEQAIISQEIMIGIEDVSNNQTATNNSSTFPETEADLLERLIPGAFAGVILFSIVISGMMIFQSASQEKKDKIAEIILSSITPKELMQGKIIGYFALGIIQVLVWIGLALPVIMWKIDIPIFKYLFTPELIVLLTIAILGYLIFASLFVGLGATIEDISTSGNFQGLVLMLPFIPLMLLGPVLSDPNGIVAQVGSYIPVTAPGILLLRLTMLEDWPVMEIAISIAILVVSVWLIMKLAGKIFQTGILLYGKNATPKEIWKWLRA